jgi:hypothetical protein
MRDEKETDVSCELRNKVNVLEWFVGLQTIAWLSVALMWVLK